MRLSHSRLSSLVWNPKKYKAIYKIGLSPKETKRAFVIGSAVHWGIEHETADLQKYFKEYGTFWQAQQYTYEQLLAESIVYGYLKNKNELFKKILEDMETGEQLELIDEIHEITLTADLPSNIEGHEPHSFLGIIDLVLLTNKGFIVIDYKTSSRTPDWSKYLEQIYRYIFLLSKVFPEVPIYKIGIINLRKAMIRQKKNETEYAFLNRLKMEYELNEDAYISQHIYTPDALDSNLLAAYIKNLSDMADYAEHIDAHQLYWWNYDDNLYGKNEYYDICHSVKDSWVIFNVKDTIFDNEEKIFLTSREAKEVDMLAINQNNILNKFEQFEAQVVAYYSIVQDISKEKLFNHIKQNFVTDDDLLELHWSTLQAKLAGLKTSEEIEQIEESEEEE